MDIQRPHDGLFREAFNERNIDNIIDLIRNTLSAEIVEYIDFSSITISKDTFIDEKLKDSQSDLLIYAKFKQTEINIYFLYEHKSFLDKYTIFQMLKYMMKIWDKDLSEKRDYFTPIIPVIFYHGKNNWNYDTNFVSYFDIDNLCDTLKRFLPDFNCTLYDLPNIPDESIEGNAYFQTIARIMKYVFHDLKGNLFYVLALIKELDDRSFKIILYYLLATSGITDIEKEKIIEVAYQLGKGDDVMTIYDELIKEGEEKGIEKGRQEGEKIAKIETAKKMKNEGFEYKLISKLTGLKIEEIEKL